mmetsp:Transcript_13471/g.29260  ORF Transcript_13471/g.29260 Transcript_13471/m.29260 type:complete len:451 (-) Transcript_13471:72-1424(-)
MTSLEEVVDPRIAVVIVWAIFFFVFIILPSVCIRCLGCCSSVDIDIDGIPRDRGEGVEDDPGFAAGWYRYMFLPAQNRLRIDELRSDVIRRYLGRFSIVLEKGHMMCLNENGEAIVSADTESISDDGTCLEKDEECQNPLERDDMASPDDYIDYYDDTAIEEAWSKKEEQGDSAEINEKGIEKSMIHIIAPAGQLGIELTGTGTAAGLTEVSLIREDSPLSGKIEVGDKIIAIEDEDVKHFPPGDIFVLLMNKAANAQRKITILRGDINMENGASNKVDSSGNEYTHVRIPFPGYDFDGVKVKEKSIPVEGNNTSNWRFPFYQKKIQVSNQQEAQEKEAEIGDKNDVNVRRKDEQRNVPHFCAICLGEYEISETISWASNSDCTHVFHQECVLKWLNTLGRKMSKYHRFSDDPSVLQLLNYKLECPCCRQDFISKLASVDEECCGDENNV